MMLINKKINLEYLKKYYLLSIFDHKLSSGYRINTKINLKKGRSSLYCWVEYQLYIYQYVISYTYIINI